MLVKEDSTISILVGSGGRRFGFACTFERVYEKDSSTFPHCPLVISTYPHFNDVLLTIFQSPKFAPPIEFVDPAALSPPEGYKDGGGKLTNALGNALGGHVFGAQHMQQLQVIQRLQAQRAAMLAARATNGQTPATGGGSTGQPQSPPTVSSATQQGNNGSVQQQQMMDSSNVCTECAECAECAAKQLQGEPINGKCLTY